jgi:hypothetical protein
MSRGVAAIGLFVLAAFMALASYGALSNLWSGPGDSPPGVYIASGAGELAVAAMAAFGAALILKPGSAAADDGGASAAGRLTGGMATVAAYAAICLVALPMRWLEGGRVGGNLLFVVAWLVLAGGLYLRFALVWAFLAIGTIASIFFIWAVQPEGAVDAPVVVWTGMWIVQLALLLSPAMRAHVLAGRGRGD